MKFCTHTGEYEYQFSKYFSMSITFIFKLCHNHGCLTLRNLSMLLMCMVTLYLIKQPPPPKLSCGKIFIIIKFNHVHAHQKASIPSHMPHLLPLLEESYSHSRCDVTHYRPMKPISTPRKLYAAIPRYGATHYIPLLTTDHTHFYSWKALCWM